MEGCFQRKKVLFSVYGPKGRPGNRGHVGELGDKGEEGNTGPPGLPGEAGKRGFPVSILGSDGRLTKCRCSI